MVPRGSKQSKKDFEDFYDDIIQNCHEFHEMTGETGDVLLLHPLMVHSVSVNSLRHARIITNPPVSLKEPFNFDRSDPTEYSIVERKTIEAIGEDRLRGWKIKGDRGSVTPNRLKAQAELKKEELQRLKSSPTPPKSDGESRKRDQVRVS